MKRLRPWRLAGAAVLAASVAGVGLALSQDFGDRTIPTPPVVTPTELLTRPVPDTLPNAALVRQGQYLVSAGDCVSCHTREDGQPFAGGYALKTPFGIIYTSNLTPDPRTGIGSWTPDMFYRAIARGIGPRGTRLYPGLPYTYFTHVSRADSDAMLAYLKTVPAVDYTPPANRLPFPLNIRFFLRGWNLLFFHPKAFQPDASRSAQWNRGAYLITGLGHCGACHTPKNPLMADENSHALQGGDLEHWVAPDLTGNPRTGLGQWSEDEIVEYLKTGRNARANAAGTMAEAVSYSTSLMSDQDLHAIAAYLKSVPSSPTPDPPNPDAAVMARGVAVYSDACASCHLADAQGQPRLFPPLRGDTMLQQRDPSGVLHIILAGGRTGPTPARPTPLSMPSFAWKLDNQQVADVSTYVRNSWGNRAAPVSADAAGRLRDKLDLNGPVHLTDNSGDR